MIVSVEFLKQCDTEVFFLNLIAVFLLNLHAKNTYVSEKLLKTYVSEKLL